MYKIKDNIDLKELEKFGFWKDDIFSIYHRSIHDDFIEQLTKNEYLLINKKRIILKAKLKCVLDLNGNLINGYDIETNKVKKYIPDLIQAGLVRRCE